MKYTTIEIFEIFNADYNFRTAVDEMAIKGLEISGETKIGDWRDHCDLLYWEELHLFFNQYFEMDIDWEEWKKVVCPEWEKTMYDLASLIAAHAKKVKIPTIKLFGVECKNAGIYRTITLELKKQGIKALSPSKDWREWIRQNYIELVHTVNKISPGAIAKVNIQSEKLYNIGFNILTFGDLLFVIACLSNLKYILIPVSIFISINGRMIINFAAKLPPKKVEISGIDNFRDLVKAIAHNEERRTKEQLEK